jgi:hypothetical protein
MSIVLLRSILKYNAGSHFQYVLNKIFVNYPHVLVGF